MKQLSLFITILFCAVMIPLASCGESDGPDSPDNSETLKKEIIGTWRNISKVSENTTETTTLTFKSNGLFEQELTQSGEGGEVVIRINPLTYTIDENILILQHDNGETEMYSINLSGKSLVLTYIRGEIGPSIAEVNFSKLN